MSRIYYVGDWAVQCGPVYAETPFNYAFKGLETINYGKWLKAALEADGRHSVNSVPTWDFYMLGPGEYEKILDEYDVVVFSDVEAKNFQLAPNFFNHRLFGTRVLTFPDRIRLTLEAVKGGKGLMLLGGWLSFNGEMGKGGWGRTGLRELLPVGCLETEDLVESTEGFTARATIKGAGALGGLDFGGFPPILGYNRTRPLPDSDILLEVAQTGDPLLAKRSFGQGQVLAYMSDPAPHWGCNFVFWDRYSEFWLRCLDLVLGR
ncbi:glutamine amidotransferase [bacterium]|nr:glutamine amidotransferase [bacterium]